MATRKRKASWKPVTYTYENVPRYCSPACGRHCTWAEYRKTQAKTEKLARILGIDRWNVVLWENLGWHGKVELKTHPNVTIQRRLPNSYLADAVVPDERQAYSFGKSPRAALRSLETRLKMRLLDIDRVLMKVSRALHS